MRKQNILTRLSIVTMSLIFCSLTLLSQTHPDFTITKKIETSPVKNQYRTGTCWSFATISFLETEAIRLGKPVLDLSEMFIARYAYTDKAIKYVRFQGKANFSEGGQAHDVINVIRKYGMSTEEAYTGLHYGSKTHNHSELAGVLQGILKGVTEKGNQPSIAWLPSFNAVLDNYLGKTPVEFDFEGKKYDPIKFAKDFVGINPDDYIELTSFKTYPYYKLANLEIPDNWSHDLYYNVPINDILKIIENAINNGYSVVWDGDVSEDGFNHSEGIAELTQDKSDEIIANGIENTRQSTFDNYSTTDDHLMHITGLAKNKNGDIYYLTKNSWGNNSNPYGGYLYMSNGFVQLKTVAIMVHKEAIPKDIRKKLNL
jgi:bleomycin hydrolase